MLFLWRVHGNIIAYFDMIGLFTLQFIDLLLTRSQKRFFLLFKRSLKLA